MGLMWVVLDLPYDQIVRQLCDMWCDVEHNVLGIFVMSWRVRNPLKCLLCFSSIMFQEEMHTLQCVMRGL